VVQHDEKVKKEYCKSQAKSETVRASKQLSPSQISADDSLDLPSSVELKKYAVYID